MIAMPDPSTFQIIPGGVGPSRRADDLRHPDARRQTLRGRSRYVLKKALKKVNDQGYTFYLGPELEFFYFASDKAPEFLDMGGYFDGLPVDRATDLRRQTIFAFRRWDSCGVQPSRGGPKPA